MDLSSSKGQFVHFQKSLKLSSDTHTHTFNGPFSRTNWVSRYQKSKTSLDFTEARDSEWQWHQLGHMPVCISLQTDNHASTPPLSFLQAGCPSCRPTNSVKALKAKKLSSDIYWKLLYPPIHHWSSVAPKRTSCDEKFFKKILTCPIHILQTFLPPLTAQNYSLKK